MTIKNERLIIIGFVIFACLFMTLIDAVISPHYSIKSIIKFTLFLILPLIYALIDKRINYRNLFLIKRQHLLLALILGISVYGLIIGGYYSLRNLFDFSNITNNLQNNIGVNKNNFIYVSLYISFINSFLEEFFFRGFAFITIKKITTRKFAYIFSASVFALYHVAIISTWFNSVLMMLIIISLFIVGIIFNYLSELSKSLYLSWIIHCFANFAINTIGFILFGII